MIAEYNEVVLCSDPGVRRVLELQVLPENPRYGAEHQAKLPNLRKSRDFYNILDLANSRTHVAMAFTVHLP
jgi:hypothetical protein